MTIKKIRHELAIVEASINAFKEDHSRMSLEKAVEAIQELNHTVGIMLWDEMVDLKKLWDETPEKKEK